jgi:hypothetical protein
MKNSDADKISPEFSDERVHDLYANAQVKI